MIDFSVFEERLRLTFSHRGKLLIIVFIVITIDLLIKVLYRIKSKSNEGISLYTLLFKGIYKTKNNLTQQIRYSIAALVLIFVICLFCIVTVYHDIVDQQYVMVEAEYTRNSMSSDGNLFIYGSIRVQVEDDNFVLFLPADWTEQEFPEGTHYGTIWYSKATKVILSFLPE